MLSYLRARLITLIISMLLSSFLIFTVVEGIPGDPASFMLGINATDDTVNALRKELGLEQGFLNRYFNWSIGMLSGDFGISYTYRVPVQELILERLKVSLPLAILSLSLTVLIAMFMTPKLYYSYRYGDVICAKQPKSRLFLQASRKTRFKSCHFATMFCSKVSEITSYD